MYILINLVSPQWQGHRNSIPVCQILLAYVYCLNPPVGRIGVPGEHPQLLADHRLFSCRDLVDSSNHIIDKIPLRIQRMT